MNKRKVLGILLSASVICGIGQVAVAKQTTKVENKVVLANKIINPNDENTLSQQQINYLKDKSIMVDGMKFTGIQVAKIAPDMNSSEFVVAPGFNPNGFASSVNEKLYNYEANLNNDAAAMKEATELHDGNPVDTCVFFQSSALRAIGQDVPDYIGYTTHLENWLANNGWTRHTDFQYLQKGDLCFAGPYHTFLFMGWIDKAKGIAAVMGNESFTEPYYRHRNLSGQSPEIYGNDSYYQTTCYWTYGKGYTGKIEGNDPVHQGGYDAIGLTTTKANSVNMRVNPNLNSNIVQTLSENVTVPVIAQDKGWFEVYYNGHMGWINEEYTTGLAESLGGDVNSNLPTVVVTSTIGLYENNKPSIHSSQITVIPYNTTITVLGYYNGWYKVNYNGNIGWVDGQYTTGRGNPIGQNLGNTSKITKVTGMTIITANSLIVDGKPAPNTEILGVLHKGDNVSVIGESNGWYEIKYNGQVGWIGSAYTTGLNKTSVNKNDTKIVNSKKNADSPNTRHHSSVNKPSAKTTDTASPKNTNSKPNKIEHKTSPIIKNKNTKDNDTKNKAKGKENIDGYIGKIRVKSIIGVDLDKEINSSEITNICNNTILSVISEKDGWYKVDYNGQIGWVDGQFTSALDDIGGTFNGINEVGLTLNKANIYSRSNDKSNVIGNIPVSTVLNLIGQQGEWYKVDYNGNIGWVNKNNLDVI